MNWFSKKIPNSQQTSCVHIGPKVLCGGKVVDGKRITLMRCCECGQALTKTND